MPSTDHLAASLPVSVTSQGDLDDRLLEELKARGLDFIDYFDRLLEHDWGDVSDEAALANDTAVEDGGLVIAFYDVDGDGSGVEIRNDVSAGRYAATWIVRA